MSLVTLADVKAHLNITSADSGGRDAKLQLKIDAAESFVSNTLGGTGGLASTAVTERITGYGNPSLVLTNLPVVSVTSVTGSDGVALAVGSLDVDTFHGIIRYSAFYPVPFLLPYYTVAYQSGYATLPADLVEAVKLMTQHLWETQRGSRTGTESSTPGDAYGRAMQLLNNYTVPGFA